MTEGQPADITGRIEFELLRLVRHLETFGRRGSLYIQMDRAGYLALRMLDEIGPASTTLIADALHLDSSTVTRQLSRLERNGFIERRPDPNDRRSTILVLLPAGRKAMYTIQRERRRRVDALLSEWTAVERDALGSALSHLNMSLTARALTQGAAAATRLRTHPAQ